MRRRLVGVVAVLACACHGGNRDRGGGGGGATDRIATVHRADLVDRVLLTGELHAAHAAELTVPRTEAWELPIRWMAEDGTAVKAGDRVLEFDNSQVTTNRETKDIALLEAARTYRTYVDTSAMDTADKDVAWREAVVAQDKAAITAALPADLLPARTAQQYQLEKKHADADVAKAAQDLAAQRAEATIEQRVKQIDLEKAKRAVDETVATLGELVRVAPRDGVIVIGEHPWEGRKFEAGDSVQPGWAIVNMPDVGGMMEVHAELNGVDDGRVAVGMLGTCTLDAYPTLPLRCAVTSLTPVARSKGRKSLRRLFAVVLALVNADQARMRPGMSVKVELQRQPMRGALVVPRGAVLFGEPVAKSAPITTRVRLVGGELRDVTLGPCDPQQCAIDRGVSDGDRVMIGGEP